MKDGERIVFGTIAGVCFLIAGFQFASVITSPKQPPLPEVTDSEKMWLELNAARRDRDEDRQMLKAILIYVRPDDEPAKQFAKTLKEAGIPNLPGVSR